MNPMRIKLPFSRKKHYLTGMDWLIHALDAASRKQLGCGNSLQIAVELAGELDSGTLEQGLSRYCRRLAPLQGRVSRDFNLAPYWRVQKKNERPVLKFSEAADREDAYGLLQAESNVPFGRGRFPVRAVCARMPGRTFVGFIFDHRLFDARGAELFLKGLQKSHLSSELGKEAGVHPAPAHLDRWREKFQAGKKVNRARIAASKNPDVMSLGRGRSVKGAANRYKIRCFDEEQTQAIFERSRKQAGPFMFLPYSLAAAFQAMNGLFLEKGQSAGDLAAAASTDMRPYGGGSEAPILFNHLSFLFFRVKAQTAGSFEPLLAALKSQFYEQVKEKMPQALAEASMLMRILPRAALYAGLNAGRPMASFSFGSTGESAFSSRELMGLRVLNMIHMPRIPPVPGAGIFFSQYQKRLNVTLSYLDSLVSEEEADRVMSRLESV